MVCTAVIGSPAAETRTASANAVAQPLPSTHVHNLFRATTNVFSGNSPDSDAAYAEIAKLGVKTIISVDGAKPDAVPVLTELFNRRIPDPGGCRQVG